MPGGDAQSQARSHASAPRNGPAHLPARVRATMRTTSMRSARRQCAIAHVCARRACRRAATPLRVSGLPAKARRASDEPARRRCSASNVPSAGPRLLADRSSSRGGPAVRTMAWCVCVRVGGWARARAMAVNWTSQKLARRQAVKSDARLRSEPDTAQRRSSCGTRAAQVTIPQQDVYVWCGRVDEWVRKCVFI